MAENVRIEWKQQELIAQISGQVVVGMEAACDLVATQAKAMAPKRTGTLAGAIGYETVVAARGDTVDGRVGARKNEAFYEWFVEMGTVHMAAKPHLRPALYQNIDAILRLICGK